MAIVAMLSLNSVLEADFASLAGRGAGLRNTCSGSLQGIGLEESRARQAGIALRVLIESMQCLRWEGVTEVKVEEAGRQRLGPAAWDEVA